MGNKYLKECSKLLVNDAENAYGLSSNILSSILPSKIRQFIFESIRNKIKNHDYQSFNPLHLQLFKQKLSQTIDDNKMISYFGFIQSSESFFRKHQCEISQTMFEFVVILYNICIFVEQMYYIDGDDSQQDIVCLATLYVDLFMDICRDLIQLSMSLSTA